MGKRWIAVRASAVLSLVGSLSILLVPVGLLGVAFVGGVRPSETAAGMPPGALKVMAVVMTVFFGALSGWGIATGIGILRRRASARISIVVFAALLALMGLCCAAGAWLMPFPAASQGPEVSPEIMRMARWGIAIFYGVLALVGVWWLVLFNTPSTKEYFGPGGATAQSGKPLSVVVIAWYLLISAGFTALAAVLRVPGMLFGLLFTGWMAAAIYLVFTAVLIYLGAGLLQLDERARVWSFAYFCFAAANGVAMVALPGLGARMDRMMAAMPACLHWTAAAQVPWERMSYGMLVSVPLMAVPVWFLVRQRSAFSRHML